MTTTTSPPRPESELSRRLKFRLSGKLGGLLLRILGRTWSITWDTAPAFVRLVDSGQTWVYSFWHEHLLSLAYVHRDRGAVVLVSLSKDGEYISQISHNLGYGTVRGSSSRGSKRAIIEMVRAGNLGHILGVTPDGPRGPRHKLQPGVGIIAQRSGLSIVPISIGVRGARRLASWDCFEIPKPFARLRVFTGEPIAVAERPVPDNAMVDLLDQVKRRMDELEERAQAWVRGDR